MKILIADDIIANRQLVSEYLRVLGYTDMDQACTGKEVLDAFNTRYYDLVLLDVMMPHTDGLTVCLYLKESLPEVKVILITAYSDFHTQARKVRADAYLSKPVTIEDLEQTINRVMS
jgi:CheY-like chemotaxis protein